MNPLAAMVRNGTMTQDVWDRLGPVVRESIRDNSELTPELIGKEGFRVEATTADGERRRFIVGKSTGWRPIHLEIKTRRSLGGFPAERSYASVRTIERVR